MRHNDYTDRYSFSAFKALSVSEKAALLAEKNKNHLSDAYQTLAKRGSLVVMWAWYQEERAFDCLNAHYMTFNEWLESEAVTSTSNERWAATPEMVKYLDERDAHEFQMGYDNYEPAAL
jgi:hypothetical protein